MFRELGLLDVRTVQNPLHTVLVGQATEVRAPEHVRQRHRDLAPLRERVEQALCFLALVRLEVDVGVGSEGVDFGGEAVEFGEGVDFGSEGVTF